MFQKILNFIYLYLFVIYPGSKIQIIYAVSETHFCYFNLLIIVNFKLKFEKHHRTLIVSFSFCNFYTSPCLFFTFVDHFGPILSDPDTHTNDFSRVLWKGVNILALVDNDDDLRIYSTPISYDYYVGDYKQVETVFGQGGSFVFRDKNRVVKYYYNNGWNHLCQNTNLFTLQSTSIFCAENQELKAIPLVTGEIFSLYLISCMRLGSNIFSFALGRQIFIRFARVFSNAFWRVFLRILLFRIRMCFFFISVQNIYYIENRDE